MGISTVPRMSTVRHTWEPQRSFTDLGTPLSEVTFCVVDLETTGAAPRRGDKITEIGAVKVRGGEVLGEFQTLVNPDAAIPPNIVYLTGITMAMVAEAPRINSALPAFFEFAHGCVLVAHNAPFDIGFLRAGAAEMEITWPGFSVVDTAVLARRVVPREESGNHRLSSLARVFHSPVTPNHRALSDARATVTVLHGLMERVGNIGIHSLEDLLTYDAKVPAERRRKRTLADHLPEAPGVYLFHSEHDEVLYVGTSRNLKKRVASYFTASEQRTRIQEMVRIATRVRGIACATPTEAAVRELRLIAAHKPAYNRKSKFPERVHYLKLTDETWPRLSIVRRLGPHDSHAVGPFASRRAAQAAAESIYHAFPLRQCRWLSPGDGSTTVAAYTDLVAEVRHALRHPEPIVTASLDAMQMLAVEQRYEAAQLHRDRLRNFLRAAIRTEHIQALARCREIVAAERDVRGHWNVHVVRWGRLAGAGVIPPRANAWDYVDQLCASAETVAEPTPDAPAAMAEEIEIVHRWLSNPGVRPIRVSGEWSCPLGSAESVSVRLEEPRSGPPSVPVQRRQRQSQWPAPLSLDAR